MRLNPVRKEWVQMTHDLTCSPKQLTAQVKSGILSHQVSLSSEVPWQYLGTQVTHRNTKWPDLFYDACTNKTTVY